MENNLPVAAFALLGRASRRLAGRQLQHSIDGGTAGYVDQFVAGKAALLDQIHHGQKKLPAPGQVPSQFLFIDSSLLTDRVVAFLHGGSPFKVWQPDSFRIRLNRRSTFNYSRDILRIKMQRESWDRCLNKFRLFLQSIWKLDRWLLGDITSRRAVYDILRSSIVVRRNFLTIATLITEEQMESLSWSYASPKATEPKRFGQQSRMN
jgi:hypothetical protein